MYTNCTTCDLTIMVNDNPIKAIEPEAFRLDLIFTRKARVYLLRTKLKTLSLEIFSGLGGLDSQILITSRTITTLKYSSNGQQLCTIFLNPQNSEEEAIDVEDPKSVVNEPFVSILLTSGFRQITGNDSLAYFLPCPVGTFTNSSSKGQQVCMPCPPGGFYSDEVGHVALSCKKCPNGSFVHIDKAPGTQSQDCRSCPQGTETDFFAGYRACKCLEGFYRTHLFEQCYKCIGGLQCMDDYASLKPGYWWKWRSRTHKDHYRAFIQNLKSSLPALSADDVRFPYAIPTSYQCPKEKSCIGGLDSPCKTGYNGPLCAVCSSGYYEQLQTCKQCPPKKWIVGQMLIVVAILLIIIAILAWTRKRNTKIDDDHSVIDIFLSKIKIVIGFYQVTYGLLETFSYIKWPDSMQVIGKYSEVLQMNVLQIAPIHCLYPAFQVDAFGNLFVMMAINAAVIGLSVIAYGIRRLIVLRNGRINDEEKTIQLSQTKAFLYRNVFFFLYTTYLSTCSMTANVLPLACRELCQDEDEDEVLCNKYLKADYSIQCQGPEYNHLLIVAYLSAVYVVAIPVASFIALWRHRRVISAKEDAEISEDPDPNMEIIAGLRFLFENYKPRSWYWELVEMSRKVILTSGLILVGEESRSYIGLTLVIAGMYGMVFSWMKPIQDGFENKMMTISLAVTVFNLAIGAVSRIPAENVSSSSEPYVEAFVFKMLVLGANSLVIGLLAVQYLVGVYRFFKEWRKNPQWSFSCCLALLLPLNDLRGEMSGLAETNVFKSQLKSGEMEMPTILIAVEDSNENLDGDGGDQHDEQGKQGYDDSIAKQENSLPNAKSIKQCNQGIQTEFFKLSLAANVVVCGPTGGK
ncbi:cysteine repeat modular protein A-like [Oculina patagonica]